jgi:hypothetical protein
VVFFISVSERIEAFFVTPIALCSQSPKRMKAAVQLYASQSIDKVTTCQNDIISLLLYKTVGKPQHHAARVMSTASCFGSGIDITAPPCHYASCRSA